MPTLRRRVKVCSCTDRGRRSPFGSTSGPRAEFHARAMRAMVSKRKEAAKMTAKPVFWAGSQIDRDKNISFTIDIISFSLYMTSKLSKAGVATPIRDRSIGLLGVIRSRPGLTICRNVY